MERLKAGQYAHALRDERAGKPEVHVFGKSTPLPYHNTQRAQHNTTQHYTIKHNTTPHNTTPHNAAQHNTSTTHAMPTSPIEKYSCFLSCLDEDGGSEHFWKLLGGKGHIKTAEEAGTPTAPPPKHTKALFK